MVVTPQMRLRWPGAAVPAKSPHRHHLLGRDVDWRGLSTARFVRSELESARMKADFAANVSHELRSPITQIRLKAESLMLGLSDTVEEQQHDYRAIVRESERLSRLVDNVLDFSAIERGAKTYALVPGDIGESVRAAIDVVEGSAELMERDVYVSIQPSLPVVAHDPDAIAQCVINLWSRTVFPKPTGPSASHAPAAAFRFP